MMPGLLEMDKVGNYSPWFFLLSSSEPSYLRSMSFYACFLSGARIKQEEREDFLRAPGSCGADCTLHQLMYSSDGPQETSGYGSEVMD